MKKILLLAIVFWGLLAPLTYHPDTKLTLRYPALENGKVWDIYGYLATHKLDIPDFHYPPAHYWWLKIHYPISRLIGGAGFDQWLASGSGQAAFDTEAMKYNLAAKFPLLLLGLISGWLIFKIVKRETKDFNKAKLAALFWYFNPITLYSLVVMGQNDIVAIFLFLLGIWWIDRWWLMALFWGLAAGVKNYPLIWAIMFLVVQEKKIFKLILKIGSVFLVYLLIMLPWLDKDYFVQAVLNSGLSQRMFIANISIGFGKEILIVPLLLVILAVSAFFKNYRDKIGQGTLLIFKSCLIILAFSHFNPQWMLWLIPFFSIWFFSKKRDKKEWLPLVIILVAWLILTLAFDDRFLVWGLLTPINPDLINFPSLAEFLKNRGIDFSKLINLAQTILAGVSLWYLNRKEKIKKNKSKEIKSKNYLIFIPWILVTLLVLLMINLKVEKRIGSNFSGEKIPLVDVLNEEMSYEIQNNLKYIEVSLDKNKIGFQDTGELLISDNKGNEFKKNFTSYNAETNSWLRIDIPKEMSESSILNLKLNDALTNGDELKVKLDNENRWAVNFFYYGKVSKTEIVNKLLKLWWWWLIVASISVFYIKTKEN